MSSFNWQCPFCNRHTTITDECLSKETHRITLKNKLGPQLLVTIAIACPNDECKELYLSASLSSTDYNTSVKRWMDAAPHSRWALRPQTSVKLFPDYVPASILTDYREACLVKELSPKASATLSRRCLQGMIRDFWGVQMDRLVDEIKALKGKVNSDTWNAIDAIRKIGNIGAHMEKDISLIVEVDPQEAGLLIELVETLIEDWYIERHERSQRMSRIVTVAAEKKSAKHSATEQKSRDEVPEGADLSAHSQPAPQGE